MKGLKPSFNVNFRSWSNENRIQKNKFSKSGAPKSRPEIPDIRNIGYWGLQNRHDPGNAHP